MGSGDAERSWNKQFLNAFFDDSTVGTKKGRVTAGSAKRTFSFRLM